MALIALSEAAHRLGVREEILEGWVQQGLLTVHHRTVTSVEGTLSTTVIERLVDEEEVWQVAESIGWLQLSAEGWEGEED